MALQKLYVGSKGAFFYDDAMPINDPDGEFAGEDYSAFSTTGQIWVETAPTQPEHVMRKGDFTTGGAREFILPISGFGTGAAKPAETILGNYLGYAFTVNDLGYFTFEVPIDWNGTSDIEIFIHWYCNEAYALQSAKVQWRLSYTATKEDGTEAVDAGSTDVDSGDISIPTLAKQLIETGLVIPAAALALHDSLGIQIKRIAASGTSPTAKPVIVSVEVEYISGTYDANL
jgi:hypothetical protein